MPAITLTPITASDRSWIARFAAEHWGADLMVVQSHKSLLLEIMVSRFATKLN